MAFRAGAEHSNISHRPQQSVPEEFSGPLELSQPFSGLVDGSICQPCPAPPLPPCGTRALGEGAQVRPQGLLSPNSTVGGGGLQWIPPAMHTPFLSLDYGIRPKHPWPRGPRPLLAQAQQRKRDGPDMAEYDYDAHL